MLNIDLIPDVPANVFVSTTPCTVNRVGDVILLPMPNTEARIPWEYIFEAYDWHVSTGIFADNLYKKNIIFLSTNEWDIDKLCKLEEQGFSMTILQYTSNDYIASVCTSCGIEGCEIDGDNITIAVNVQKCEMVCNQ